MNFSIFGKETDYDKFEMNDGDIKENEEPGGNEGNSKGDESDNEKDNSDDIKASNSNDDEKENLNKDWDPDGPVENINKDWDPDGPVENINKDWDPDGPVENINKDWDPDGDHEEKDRVSDLEIEIPNQESEEISTEGEENKGTSQNTIVLMEIDSEKESPESKQDEPYESSEEISQEKECEVKNTPKDEQMANLELNYHVEKTVERQELTKHIEREEKSQEEPPSKEEINELDSNKEGEYEIELEFEIFAKELSQELEHESNRESHQKYNAKDLETDGEVPSKEEFDAEEVIALKEEVDEIFKEREEELSQMETNEEKNQNISQLQGEMESIYEREKAQQEILEKNQEIKQITATNSKNTSKKKVKLNGKKFELIYNPKELAKYNPNQAIHQARGDAKHEGKEIKRSNNRGKKEEASDQKPYKTNAKKMELAKDIGNSQEPKNEIDSQTNENQEDKYRQETRNLIYKAQQEVARRAEKNQELENQNHQQSELPKENLERITQKESNKIEKEENNQFVEKKEETNYTQKNELKNKELPENPQKQNRKEKKQEEQEDKDEQFHKFHGEWAKYLSKTMNNDKDKEISSEIKKELTEILSKFDELQNLVKKLKRREITKTEAEKEFEKLESTFSKNGRRENELFKHFGWFQRFYEKTWSQSLLKQREKGFIRYISKRLDELKKIEKNIEHIKSGEEQNEEKWATTLKNYITQSHKEEIPEEIQNDLISLIDKYNDLKRSENDLPEKLKQIFQDLKQYKANYEVFHERGYEKSIPYEVGRIAKKLRNSLEVIKKEATGSENFKNILSKNLNKSTMNHNEKSKSNDKTDNPTKKINPDSVKICSIILKNMDKSTKEVMEKLSKTNLKKMDVDLRKFNKQKIERLIWLISVIGKKDHSYKKLVSATMKKYNVQRRAAKKSVMEILEILNSIDANRFDIEKFEVKKSIERVKIDTEILQSAVDKLKVSNWTIVKINKLIGADLYSVLNRGDRIKKKSLEKLNELIKKENLSLTILPEKEDNENEKIYVKVNIDILKKICNELKQNGVSKQNISKQIGTRIDSILSRDLKMPKSSFLKLNQLYYEKCKKQISRKDYSYDTNLVTKNFEENEESAEICCILLGDGNLNYDGLRITLNRVDEKDYVNYIRNFLKNFFHIEPNEYIHKKGKGIKLIIYGIAIVKGLELKGLKKGNKVKNQVSVPLWIMKQIPLVKAGLRGLFDTDGSIGIDKRYKKLQLSFSSDSKPLAQSFKEMCERLNIKCSNLIPSARKNSNQIRYRVIISAKKDVKNFLELVSPQKMNEKYRRIYLGTNLIYLTANKRKLEAIEKEIRKDFPKPRDRQYSKAFAIYLKQTCEKILGYEITNEKIDDAISNSLKYKKNAYKNKKN